MILWSYLELSTDRIAVMNVRKCYNSRVNMMKMYLAEGKHRILYTK